jgi:uncharacterized small protein (DUF1192 family)
MESKENQEQIENQQEPLSHWVILERLNNAVGVIAGLFSIYTSLASPSALAKPLELQIPQKIISTIEQLKMAKDNETLSKAMNALSELQKLISEKRSELKQLSIQEVEFDKNIAALDEEATKLEALRNRINASREAIDWLDPATQEDFLKVLAKEAGNTVLGVDNPEIEQFYFDIEQFLRLIHSCLIVCRPNLLDRVVTENELPTTNIQKSVYQEALRFIIKKIPQTMNFQAKTELIVYLNYLNGILSQSD